ncbi:GNAT family N-acetyltransferase [Pararcticibacter amylolyticus]|uniref:GNAT family N-acetyltransferase n=1 Tax=Pararcticibacter amylolyticus TaxID=2173175 RepID=A0A2U2PAV4_9SPHI|nr:GNAT family N-acetyltransferase [Pararcticibacter amylolyticus]PWG78490.1 GNAT family N-acetyltransferase [Pararcticibacter amylolyticus]
MSTVFKEITKDDFTVIKEIYDHYILHSTATFHTEEVSLEELKEIIPLGHAKYKSFLIYDRDSVCGYCYMAPYKKRQAYDRSAEVTLYLRPGCTGRGIGRKAMEKMEEVASANEIKVLLGIITGENTDSIRLFERNGYEKCAHFKGVGEKFNRVLDVVAYQKML